MNEQKIFDRVVEHLFTQNEQAMDDCGNCYYRAPNGCKCAVGVLISNSAYRTGMENQNVYGLRELFYKSLPQYILDNMFLLNDLQDAHDNAGQVWVGKYLYNKLWNVAQKHNLSTHVLDKYKDVQH